MTHPWDPMHPVEEALARRLLSEQFPGYTDGPLFYVGRGWDNDVWRCGETPFSCRFPHGGYGEIAHPDRAVR